MPSAVEIVATYLREFQRWPDAQGGVDTILAECWYDQNRGDEDAIFSLADTLTVRTKAEPDELIPEQDYRFRGQWKDHPRYGRQFHASSFTLVKPASRTAVVAYLSHAGQGLGFGDARAVWCWEQYGQEALTILREEPERVVEDMAWGSASRKITGRTRRLKWDIENARKMAARLEETAAIESCLLDLTDLLDGRGFRRTLPKDIVRIRGNKGADEIRKDAYDMLFWTDPKTGRKLPGIGFRLVDKLYLDLGGDPAAIRRQALAAWNAIHEESSGHTWYPVTVAEEGLKKCTGGADIRLDEAIDRAMDDDLLVEIRTDGVDGPISETGKTRWFAENRSAGNEEIAARLVAGMMEEEERWPV